MKKQVLSIVAIFCLLLMPAVAISASSSGRFTVNIPFDFNAGKTQLKAGRYIVDSNNVRGVPRLSSADHRTTIFVSTFGGETNHQGSPAKLVFRRYGQQYFLAQIWNEGSTEAMQLPTSRAERELAKELKHLAQHTAQPELVAVLAP